MRVVVDTNVIVAALLTPGRTPERCLDALRAQGATVLVDERIVAEYRAVIARPKFRSVDPARASALVESLIAGAERVEVTAYAGPMIDGDDRAFVEVARAGRADAIVTGNAKHFPRDVGVEVLSPAEALARWG
ncbi:MAG: putative toxin-antitoxin system toxin component, PIN family [Polyangiales bacterium]